MTVTIYRQFVEPELKRYESTIDGHMEKGKSIAENQYKKFARTWSYKEMTDLNVYIFLFLLKLIAYQIDSLAR